MNACLRWAGLLTLFVSLLGHFPVQSAHATPLAPDCTNASLINAITQANTNNVADSINLPAGCVYTFTAPSSTSPQNNGPNALPVILNDVPGLDLTLNGNGATLLRAAGGTNFRLLGTDTDVTLEINNLTVRQGKTPNEGGGIHILERSNVFIRNSTFEDNVALATGDEDGGGAIFSKLSHLQVENSRFTRNSAGNGGAIKNLINDLTLSNSVFTQNSSTLAKGTTNGGGAIIIDGANRDGTRTISMSDVTFRNNKSRYQGGALMSYLYSSDRVTIERSTFADNLAEQLPTNPGQYWGYGGGAWLGGEGAAYSYSISSSTFNNNVAHRSGGGLYLQGDGYVDLTNSTIALNQALNPRNPTDGLGGGVFTSNIRMTITNSTIASNLAGWMGGGFWVAQPNIILMNSIVANNTALNGGNPWNIKRNCGTSAAYPGPVTSYMLDGGHNLEWPPRNLADGSDGYCTNAMRVADPLLGALLPNGGTTATLALAASSPAVNTASTCPTFDQRGRTRAGQCDVGAFEYDGSAFVPDQVVYIPMIRR